MDVTGRELTFLTVTALLMPDTVDTVTLAPDDGEEIPPAICRAVYRYK
jgi:hypothetical protein